MPTALAEYQPTCVWPVRPLRRIAVLTSGKPSAALVAAVAAVVGDDQWVRWVERGEIHDDEQQETRRALDQLAPWWEWADVVITDASDQSIAECVGHGWVPAVGLPPPRDHSVDARRALELVHRWSARGLALHLSLDHPSTSLLASAAGLRTRRRPFSGVERRSA